MLQGQEIDTVQFDRNRAQVRPDTLKPFFGKHVAWNSDGTQVVASGDDVAEVLRHLDNQGIDPLTTVLDYIPDPDASYLE
jgi:hypothetical protein